MDATTYITRVRWRFATTLPEWPHEYTVKAWRPDATDEFVWFCRLIRSEGVVEPWPPPPQAPVYRNHYLRVGDHQYWAMGPRGDRDPPEEMTVINRARVPG